MSQVMGPDARRRLLERYAAVQEALVGKRDAVALSHAVDDWKTLREEDPELAAAAAAEDRRRTGMSQEEAPALAGASQLSTEDWVRIHDEMAALADEKETLEEQYEKSLPSVALSRSPFSGELYARPFDNAGVDGLWWNEEEPVRPGDVFPDTFVAFTGAMRINRDALGTVMPFTASPGPDRPFVVPRMLADDWSRAVLCQVPVGAHVGWSICYFSERDPAQVGRVAEWGLDVCFHEDAEQGLVAELAPVDLAEADFDLAPWIACGKLLWIAPRDAAMTLRSGLQDCPYLRLEGTGQEQHIRRGEVWSTVADEDDAWPGDTADLLLEAGDDAWPEDAGSEAGGHGFGGMDDEALTALIQQVEAEYGESR